MYGTTVNSLEELQLRINANKSEPVRVFTKSLYVFHTKMCLLGNGSRAP